MVDVQTRLTTILPRLASWVWSTDKVKERKDTAVNDYVDAQKRLATGHVMNMMVKNLRLGHRQERSFGKQQYSFFYPRLSES